MEEPRKTPPEQPPPRQVTIRDKRRVIHDGPEARAASAAGASGGGSSPAGGSGPAGGSSPAAAPDHGEAASPASAASVEADLAQARAEAASHLEDLQRLKAEFDNYRKRIVKEQTGLIERAAGNLVMRLLPVLDNFELAVASAEESHDFERMLRGGRRQRRRGLRRRRAAQRLHIQGPGRAPGHGEGGTEGRVGARPAG
jgi:hypothetical protein